MGSSMKKTMEDHVIDAVTIILSVLLLVLIVYPFWYCLIISLNDGQDAIKGGIYIWVRKFTWENYQKVFHDGIIYHAFFVSVMRTIVGTVASVFCTGIFAYALSHRGLYFRNVYMALLIIAMYVSGGIVPSFILMKALHLTNTFWVYIAPNLISVFNVILFMNFFNALPASLEESAKIDGANDIVIFCKIVFPLSAPVFATIALFNGVGQWNSWYDCAYYTTSQNLKVLSYVLYDLINKANLASISQIAGEMAKAGASAAKYTVQTIRMATMFIVIIPIMCVYPFLQKYFVKGITLGAVKE